MGSSGSASSATVGMYQTGDLSSSDPCQLGTLDGRSMALTTFPLRLAGAKNFLLAGMDENDAVRFLWCPQKGSPEIKQLRVTLKQILAKAKEIAEHFDRGVSGSGDMDSMENSKEESGGEESDALVRSDDDGETENLDVL